MLHIFRDFSRVFVLLLVMGALLYLADPSNVVVFQAMGIGIFLVGGTHLTRRVLFNKLDLQVIAQKAVAENNVSAAIVFASIVFFLVSVIVVSMSVLK